VEVRGTARFVEQGVTEIAQRIAARYLEAARRRLQPTQRRCAAGT
jgi:hypothetical protein